MVRKWTGNGFWLAAGLAGGLLVADLARPSTVGAVASCSATDGLILATGNSVNGTTEMLWALDDKGKLACFVFGPNGQSAGNPSTNLGQFLEIPKGKKARFSMVTGKWQAQGQIADALYVAESNSGTVVGIRLIGLSITPTLLGNLKSVGN